MSSLVRERCFCDVWYKKARGFCGILIPVLFISQFFCSQFSHFYNAVPLYCQQQHQKFLHPFNNSPLWNVHWFWNNWCRNFRSLLSRLVEFVEYLPPLTFYLYDCHLQPLQGTLRDHISSFLTFLSPELLLQIHYYVCYVEIVGLKKTSAMRVNADCYVKFVPRYHFCHVLSITRMAQAVFFFLSPTIST